MLTPKLPQNEAERLLQLQDYNILDTLPEKDFDDITRIASLICQTPISLITLIDDKRQFFKSRQGLDLVETPKEISFCAHAILQPDTMMVIPDSLKDDRFADNPAVTGFPNVVFYAGVPLVNPEGHALGTLCVVDHQPRELTETQVEALKSLANQVVAQLELRRKVKQLEERELALKASNEQLDRFASVISHDLKSPLNNIVALTHMLQDKHAHELKLDGQQMVSVLNTSAERLRDMVNSVLDLYRSTDLVPQKEETFLLKDLMQDIHQLLSPPDNIRFEYCQCEEQITTSRIALQLILQNLINNAIHYNDKPQGLIQIRFTALDSKYKFEVKDNGRGIPEKHHKRIFNLFQTSKNKASDQVGTGIGLATVQKLVEKLGGEVSISSEVEKGTTFTFTLEKH